MVAMKTSNEQYQHSQSSDRDFKIIISNIRHTIMHTHEYCWDHCFKCMTLIKIIFLASTNNGSASCIKL